MWAWLWGLVYPVAEVLTWVLVEPVYLLQADLMAWECLLAVRRVVLVYPPGVRRAALAYPSGVAQVR